MINGLLFPFFILFVYMFCQHGNKETWLICMIIIEIVWLSKSIWSDILGCTTKKHSTTKKRPYGTNLYKFKMDTICERHNGGKNSGELIQVFQLLFICRISLKRSWIQDNFHQLVVKEMSLLPMLFKGIYDCQTVKLFLSISKNTRSYSNWGHDDPGFCRRK